MNVFFDTNVLMDVLERREPFYMESARVWTLAETGQIRGYISVLSLANIFYILRRRGPKRQAYETLKLLRDIFHLVSFDVDVAQQAMDSGLADFEDAVQLFSAIRCDARTLVTRNISDFPPDRLPIRTPRGFLETRQAR